MGDPGLTTRGQAYASCWHAGTVQRIDTHRELLRLSGGDPWIRWSLADPLRGEVWLHEGIVLLHRPYWRRAFWLAPLRDGTTNGASNDEPARVLSALEALRDSGHLERLEARGLSIVQQHSEAAHQVFQLGEGGDWEWMWARSAPPEAPAESDIVALDDTADAAELIDFSHAHNPRVWADIGSGHIRRWVGIRSPAGDLLAVGGVELEETGVPHLTGIVTSSARRAHGLGTAISAYLTRSAIATHGVCTLSMYSDNTTARRLYDRLGYRTARAWHSRTLR